MSSLLNWFKSLSIGGLNPLEWCGVVCLLAVAAYGGKQLVRYLRSRKARPPVEAKISRPARTDLVAGGEETVLVVDDDPSVLKAHAKLIASLGYKVIEALGGTTALDLVKQHRPDLVVLDLLMPEQDGIETFSAIREMVPDQRAIVLSGYAGPTMVNSIQSLGVHTYLVKPVERSILGKAIRDELDRVAA